MAGVGFRNRRTGPWLQVVHRKEDDATPGNTTPVGTSHAGIGETTPRLCRTVPEHKPTDSIRQLY